MRSKTTYGWVGGFAGAFLLLAARGANAYDPLVDYVQRQPTTPGVAESGHLNITGTAKAGQFVGGGSSLTSLNASALASGIVPVARLDPNVALVNKNNLFSFSQRFASHINFIGQNNGIFFATPTLNSATPMITMGGDDNSSYTRMVLGHSIAHPDWGLRYSGGSGLFQVMGPGGPGISLFQDGRLGVGGTSSASALYVYAASGLNGGTFQTTDQSRDALRVFGTSYFTSNINLGGNLGVNTSTPSYDLSIGDSDTGIEGQVGALDVMVNAKNVLSVRSTGLGIGRTPSAPLDVLGTAFFRNSTNSVRTRIFTNGQDVGEIWTQDPNAYIKAYISSYQTGGNYGGVLAACDTGGATQSWIDVSPTTGQGRLVADVKNFRSPNPRDPKTDIYYASLEGPEAAMYVRGSGRLVNGRAVMDLPLHFKDLAAKGTYTVQLTPASFRSKGLGYEIGQDGTITVGELGDGKGSYEFSWVVTAVRKGFEDYEVVRPWTDAPHAGMTEQEAWAARQRKLNSQKAP